MAGPGTSPSVPLAGTALAVLHAGTGKISWDVLSRSLSFVLSIVVARKLGPEGFGAFALYWYSAWMLSQATDLGVHLVSLRDLASASPSEGRRIFRSALLAKAALTTAALVALALVVIHRPSGFDPRFATALVVAHLLGSWIELFGIVLRSRRKIAREGFVLVALRLSWLLAALVVLSRGASLGWLSRGASLGWLSRGAGPGTLGAALALSCLPALALALAFLAKEGWLAAGTHTGSPRKETPPLLARALPLGLVSAVTLVYLRADLLIVSALSGAAEAGYFQSAFRLFEATFVLSGGIAAGTFPLLAARVGEKGFESLSRSVLAFLFAVAVPIAALFAFVPQPILALVYGEDFGEAARPLTFLGVALVAVFANALTTHLLVAAGRSRRLLAAVSTRLVVGVGLDLLLVPALGAEGAALAVAGAEWVLLSTSLFWTADLLGFSVGAGRPVSREETSPCS